MNLETRVVFDCMIFLQAIVSDLGSSFACFERVRSGEAKLLVSPEILFEVRDVLKRPKLRNKWPILDSPHPEDFLRAVEGLAEVFTNPAKAFPLPRDPDDEIYLDVAIEAAAEYLVTWNDRHLTYLMRQDTPEGRDFCARFPALKIVDPPTFLRETDALQSLNRPSNLPP